MTDEKRDYRAEVTADIIRLLDAGTAPWQQPWEEGRTGVMPYNPVTNKPYRGGNILALMIAATHRGYDDPRWMTYKQAQENGWQVRKGERASYVEFWDVHPDKEDETKKRFVHKVYAVFNAQQIDGLPALVIEPRKPFEIIAEGERILAVSGATIRHGGNRAFYNRAGDYIQMPQKEQFVTAPAYYATACHELGHWTGHPSRLNRETLTKSRGYNPEDEHYAREELVAEIASLYMAAETGLPHDPSQHAAYVGSWLKALRKDKNEIFRAASAASSAADYVLKRNREPEPTLEPAGSIVQRVMASRGLRRLR